MSELIVAGYLTCCLLGLLSMVVTLGRKHFDRFDYLMLILGTAFSPIIFLWMIFRYPITQLIRGQARSWQWWKNRGKK